MVVNNPPVNALSWHVRQGLFDGINQAVANGAKAIVVICDGRTFIAGADISEFGGGAPQAAGLHDVQAAMEDAPVPVIAAIHGTALGGGLEVALCAHYRVALSSAKFGLPEVNLGLLPGAGGTQRLPRLVGVPKALEMMTSGRHVGSAEALAGGLVDEVVDGDLADLRTRRSRSPSGPSPRTCRSPVSATATTRSQRPRATTSCSPTSARRSPARRAASSPPSTTSSASRRPPTCRSTRA